MPISVIYITHPDEATAQRVSNFLLEKRLVACANIFPMSSAYWWQSAIQQEQEWVSLVKTTPGLVGAVEAAVLSVHPYAVPCIMRWEAAANAAYEQWIVENVGGE